MKALSRFYAGGDDLCLKVLFFILPFGLATIRHYGSSVFLLISLIVLGGIFHGRGDIQRSIKEYKHVYIFLVLFFAAMAVSFINSSDTYGFFKNLEKISYVLLIVPFTICFYGRNYIKYFNFGIIYSAFVNFTVAIFSVFYFGLDRARGYYHPIIFGDLMVLFGSIVLVNAMYGLKFNKIFVFKLISAALYFLAAILSGSRGAIFALPVILLVVFFLLEYSLKVKICFSFSVLILSVAIILIFKFSVPAGGYNLVDKLNETGTNITKFFSGEKKNSSLGQRLMMWEIALETFKEHPIIGTGLGDFHLEIEERIASKKTELNYVWPHAHNIYFNFLAISGLFGLFTMVMSLFVVPFRVVHKRQKGKSIGAFDRNYFIVALISFMLFGLTEDWFSRSTLVVSFILCFSVYISPFPQGEEH